MIEPLGDATKSALPGFAPRLELTFPHGDAPDRAVVSLATAAALPALRPSIGAWLTEREQSRIARAVEKRRNEYVLGRYAAKTALAVWNRRESLAGYTILPGAFEQPVVQEPSQADVTLAHTGDVAIAVAHDRRHPMGVDVETVDAERVEVLRTQVGRDEVPANLPFSDAEALFLIWAAKEALSKALRCGLTCPFEVLAVADVHALGSGLCRGVFKNFGQYQFASWESGGRAFALVASRNAELDSALTQVVEFTRQAGGAAKSLESGV